AEPLPGQDPPLAVRPDGRGPRHRARPDQGAARRRRADAPVPARPLRLLRRSGQDARGHGVGQLRPHDGRPHGRLRRAVPGGGRQPRHAGQGQPQPPGDRGVQDLRRLLPRLDRRAGRPPGAGLHPQGRGARVPRAGHGGGLAHRGRGLPRVHRRRRQGQRLLRRGQPPRRDPHLRRAAPVKFGIAFANTGPFAHPDGAAALADAAEQAGFESVWAVEHVVVPRDYASTYPYARDGKMPGGSDFDLPDPLVWLTWVAARTTTLRVATGILILPQRNPIVLAKEVATLDVLSGGRVQLGVGIGWLREEFEVLGASFPDRARRTEEHVEVLRALWREEAASFQGETVSFTDTICRPRPVGGTVPIHVGGHAAAAARRAGRIGDGFFPAKGDLPALLGELRAAAEG